VTGRLLSVAWSKEGDTLYTGDINGLVRQWKLNSQTSTLTMRLAKVESRCHIWTIIVLQYSPRSLTLPVSLIWNVSSRHRRTHALWSWQGWIRGHGRFARRSLRVGPPDHH
jgi:WD40 repeat protein